MRERGSEKTEKWESVSEREGQKKEIVCKGVCEKEFMRVEFLLTSVKTVLKTACSGKFF